jgi:hypothetical protein
MSYNNDGTKTWETISYITRDHIYDILCQGTPKSPAAPGRSNAPRAFLYNGILNRFVRMNFFDLREAFAPASRPKDDHISRLDLYVERNLRGEIVYVRVG